MSQKRAIRAFLSRKSMVARLSIAFEDFLGSSIAPQVMPPCLVVAIIEGFYHRHNRRGHRPPHTNHRHDHHL